MEVARRRERRNGTKRRDTRETEVPHVSLQAPTVQLGSAWQAAHKSAQPSSWHGSTGPDFSQVKSARGKDGVKLELSWFVDGQEIRK